MDSSLEIKGTSQQSEKSMKALASKPGFLFSASRYTDFCNAFDFKFADSLS